MQGFSYEGLGLLAAVILRCLGVFSSGGCISGLWGLVWMLSASASEVGCFVVGDGFESLVLGCALSDTVDLARCVRMCLSNIEIAVDLVGHVGAGSSFGLGCLGESGSMSLLPCQGHGFAFAVNAKVFAVIAKESAVMEPLLKI
ncbi:hypothetical protein U1Q18_015674 [Sarracenia purpurea var. burkii]